MAIEPTNRKRRIPIRGASLLLCLCLHASAADRTIAQFVHKAWVAKDGAPANITAITQTTDGYLWLASSQGLYRFDGVEFERFEAGSRPSPLNSVWSLLACPNGDLWAGSAASGITLVRRGASRSYTKADGFPDSAVLSIARDRDGSIWAATKDGLLQFDGRSWARMGSESGIEGTPNSLYVDGRGTLWVTTVETIYFRPKGAQIFQQTGLHTAWVEQLVESPGGVIWMVQTTRSVRPMPPSAKDPEIMVGSQHVLFDRDGALWITTLGDGLRRLAHPDSLTHEKFDKSSDQLERFTADLGLSSDYADTIFQDREGNIWVGTSGGLDRFSKGAIIPGPIQTNRMTRFALAPDGDGDVWLADLSAHVGRIHKGQWFPENGVTSFSASPDPKGGAWIATFDRVRHEVDGSFTDINFPQSLLANPQPVRMAPDNLGALWVSGSFGVLVRRGGKWHTVDFPSGFPGKTPSLVYGDTAGRVWLGFKENAILLIDGNAQRSLSEKDGLHAGAILAISVRGGSTWVAGSNGLQLFDGQRFRDITPPEGGSFGNISGVLETSDGSLWLSAYNGIIRLAPPEVFKLKAGENHVESTRFDAYDGLPGPTQQVQPYPSLVQATDGTLWFATSAGPVWIDPNDIPHNALPPSVAIRSVTAHGKRYSSFANLHLPKLTRDLDIAYTALSLTVPERVHFRYMLEGSDKDWRDGGTRRQASYTNLGPGPYRFRLMASNNDGVWNEAGAAASFRIDAAFYQTLWFQALCYLAGLSVLWLIYRYQLHEATARVHSRMAGQIAERERIARELHDTLLQSFQGLLFEFQAGRNLLFSRPEKAAHTLDDAIGSAEAAIAEGRYAIQGLRSGSTDGHDLALLFSAVLRELSDTQAWNGTSPEFRVTVEGAPRTLPPVLQDELYRIGREVLRNAVRHAQAKRIELEVRYGADEFRLRIRDDGIGIDPKVLSAGARPGHWGLPGVRERAKLAGARLDFWGEAGAGTEVQIKVPAAVAYATPRGTDIFKFFRRKVTIHAD